MVERDPLDIQSKQGVELHEQYESLVQRNTLSLRIPRAQFCFEFSGSVAGTSSKRIAQADG